ncbi:MAG: prolipoprotein diacylglyceryl transferase [Bacteroidetes bacterium]|nr:prolipoprotein diacylglyceryl transferase [Bacteroidota bacterium]
MLNWITWTASPDILHIGPVTIRYYGLFFALSFMIAYRYFQFAFKKESIPDTELDRLAIYCVLGVVVGARLGHVFFYEPQDYIKHPLDILKIWQGGLASHGAAIGLLIAMWFYSRSKIIPNYMWILDRVVISLLPGAFLVRMGNLMNSEIYGHETSLPWGFRFVQDISAQHNMLGKQVEGCIISNDMMFCPRHPTQLYEGLCYLTMFFILFFYYKKRTLKLAPGRVFGMFLIMLFSIRFLVEFVKEDQVAFEQSLPLNMGQMLSIPFILAGIIILVWSYRKKQGNEATVIEV